jgi:hypothetical protein
MKLYFSKVLNIWIEYNNSKLLFITLYANVKRYDLKTLAKIYQIMVSLEAILFKILTMNKFKNCYFKNNYEPKEV